MHREVHRGDAEDMEHHDSQLLCALCVSVVNEHPE
jgi:hypothetical protein